MISMYTKYQYTCDCGYCSTPNGVDKICGDGSPMNDELLECIETLNDLRWITRKRIATGRIKPNKRFGMDPPSPSLPLPPPGGPRG